MIEPEILVLFDIDGTLLRAAGSGRAATERAMQEVFGTVGKLADYRFSGKTDWHTLLTLLGIITGNMPQMADLKLRAAGFDPQTFALAVYGSEAPVRRQLVPLALERSEQRCGKHFDPSNTVFIGDTPDDIDCAHSIGAR